MIAGNHARQWLNANFPITNEARAWAQRPTDVWYSTLRAGAVPKLWPEHPNRSVQHTNYYQFNSNLRIFHKGNLPIWHEKQGLGSAPSLKILS
jgi:hypothetical protein